MEKSRIKLGEGRQVIGQKIGLNSPAMVSMANVDEPDYRVLLDDTRYNNPIAEIPD